MNLFIIVISGSTYWHFNYIHDGQLAFFLAPVCNDRVDG